MLCCVEQTFSENAAIFCFQQSFQCFVEEQGLVVVLLFFQHDHKRRIQKLFKTTKEKNFDVYLLTTDANIYEIPSVWQYTIGNVKQSLNSSFLIISKWAIFNFENLTLDVDQVKNDMMSNLSTSHPCVEIQSSTFEISHKVNSQGNQTAVVQSNSK